MAESRAIMKTHIFSFMTVTLLSTAAWGMEEGMPKMPRIQPKKTYTIPTKEAGEDLLEQRGYGDQESSVRMMNLMMVGGSGSEGMDMAMSGHESHMPRSAPSASYDYDVKITPDPPQAGSNILVVEMRRKSDAKPAQGLEIKAQVSMTSMDMGTEEPKVREIAPGRYQLKANFSMKGPWAVKLSLPEGGEKVLNFNAGSTQ
jgi:hypothetical protein